MQKKLTHLFLQLLAFIVSFAAIIVFTKCSEWDGDKFYSLRYEVSGDIEDIILTKNIFQTNIKILPQGGTITFKSIPNSQISTTTVFPVWMEEFINIPDAKSIVWLNIANIPAKDFWAKNTSVVTDWGELSCDTLRWCTTVLKYLPIPRTVADISKLDLEKVIWLGTTMTLSSPYYNRSNPEFLHHCQKAVHEFAPVRQARHLALASELVGACRGQPAVEQSARSRDDFRRVKEDGMVALGVVV